MMNDEFQLYYLVCGTYQNVLFKDPTQRDKNVLQQITRGSLKAD